MSRPLQYVVNARYGGEIYTFNDMGIAFENPEIFHFKISRKATFDYLKDRIQTNIQNGRVSQIDYRNVVHFGNNLIKFVSLKVRDDNDVETIFVNHEFSSFDSIDLYIKFQPS